MTEQRPIAQGHQKSPVGERGRVQESGVAQNCPPDAPKMYLLYNNSAAGENFYEYTALKVKKNAPNLLFWTKISHFGQKSTLRLG